MVLFRECVFTNFAECTAKEEDEKREEETGRVLSEIFERRESGRYPISPPQHRHLSEKEERREFVVVSACAFQ
jgi:hypothetical protein